LRQAFVGQDVVFQVVPQAVFFGAPTVATVHAPRLGPRCHDSARKTSERHVPLLQTASAVNPPGLDLAFRLSQEGVEESYLNRAVPRPEDVIDQLPFETEVGRQGAEPLVCRQERRPSGAGVNQAAVVTV
jgi:hypothetical protein